MGATVGRSTHMDEKQRGKGLTWLISELAPAPRPPSTTNLYCGGGGPRAPAVGESIKGEFVAG
jgi:hypothetical protein